MSKNVYTANISANEVPSWAKSSNDIVQKKFVSQNTNENTSEINLKEIVMKAQQGDADAQAELASIYSQGHLLPKDSQKAFEWFEKSALQNNPRGLHGIALGYQYTNKNIPKAISYFEKTIATNDYTWSNRAKRSLGILYLYEKDFKNETKGIQLIKESADAFDKFGLYHLGYFYYFGDFGFTQNYQNAVKYFRLSANENVPDAQFFLGSCYFYGNGVAQDYFEAVKYFKLASAQEERRACCNLAECYIFGDGCDTSYDYSDEILRLLKLSAEKGFARAYQRLAELYIYGDIIPQNFNLAQFWAQKAFDNNCINGQLCFIMGDCYYREGNYIKAKDFFNKGAEDNHADCQYYLGLLYQVGDVSKNKHSAEYWFRKAAEQGHEKALKYLR